MVYMPSPKYARGIPETRENLLDSTSEHPEDGPHIPLTPFPRYWELMRAVSRTPRSARQNTIAALCFVLKTEDPFLKRTTP